MRDTVSQSAIHKQAFLIWMTKSLGDTARVYRPYESFQSGNDCWALGNSRFESKATPLHPSSTDAMGNSGDTSWDSEDRNAGRERPARDATPARAGGVRLRAETARSCNHG